MGVVAGVPGPEVEGGEAGTGGGPSIMGESTTSSNREEGGIAVAGCCCFAGVEGGEDIGVLTALAGDATASGAGVELREGGADMLLGRGARFAAEPGSFEGGAVREVDEAAGVVPAAGRGFEGARVREDGVR